MDNGQTSHDLLGHFDQPKTLELPDFEWVDDVIPFAPAVEASSGVSTPDPAPERFIEVPRDTRRGVCWVLAWAGALAVLAIATGVLTQFAYVVADERALLIAARAGAMEATLPRATYQSVTAAVDRRLSQYPSLASQLHLSLFQNGTPVQSYFRQRDGDRFAITLSVPGDSAVPGWVRNLAFWRSNGSLLQAHAEQVIPGRKLAYRPVLPARN
jgi:hypothetical protein